MSHDLSDLDRRTVLLSAAGLALGHAARAAPGGPGAPPASPKPPGAGDFAFLAGNWTIRHRKRKDGSGPAQWDLFEGEATVWSALGGLASIEELRVPAKDFSGMGVRLFDAGKRQWADHWVNSKSGVLGGAMYGTFADGVGTFLAEETEDGRPVLARGVWDRITPATCRWHQGLSRDGGKAWEETWFMEWTRARP